MSDASGIPEDAHVVLGDSVVYAAHFLSRPGRIWIYLDLVVRKIIKDRN